jgi:hypothetical protein
MACKTHVFGSIAILLFSELRRYFCDSPLDFFKLVDIFLFVGIPNWNGKFQVRPDIRFIKFAPYFCVSCNEGSFEHPDHIVCFTDRLLKRIIFYF